MNNTIEEIKQKYQYLDDLKQNLDDDQLKVCCHKSNAVVAAGAGSGKTQVLATRFAWLVMEQIEDSDPAKILTLTYTKKAAAEMYVRIYNILTFFSKDSHCPQEKRSKAKKALEKFNSVHIQTLDSFCGEIVRKSANLYGIRPDFSTGNANSFSSVKFQALQFVINILNDNSSKNKNKKDTILHFSSSDEIQKIADIFATTVYNHTSLASEKDFFKSFYKVQIKVLCEEWKKLCKKFQETAEIIFSSIEEFPFFKDDFIAEYKNLIFSWQDFLSLDVEKLFNESNFFETKIAESEKKLISFFEKIKKLKYPKFSDKEFKNESDKLFLKEKYNSEFKPLMDSLKQNFTNPKPDKNLADGFVSLFATIKEQPYNQVLCELLDDFTQIINNSKRASGNLSFSDVSSMALKILIEEQSVRDQMINSFDFIMIDEFQDNNASNRDLLFLLSIPQGIDLSCLKNTVSKNSVRNYILENKLLLKNKLFFVGDEKQSIYKFRGADVSVFSQLKQDLAKIGGENGEETYLHMSNNYRSNENLLSSFNTMFGAFVPQEDGSWQNSAVKNTGDLGNAIFESVEKDQKDYEAYYPNSTIAKKVTKDKNHKSIKPAIISNFNESNSHAVLFLNDEHFKNNSQNFISAKDNVYYFIAKKIKELHNSSTEQSKWSDFAILDKSRTDRKLLCRWLEHFEIPYSLDFQSNLFAESITNDIGNFLRICIYPSDTNAAASFLCSPFVGLSVSETENIFAIYKNNNAQLFSPSVEEQIKQSFSTNPCAFEKYIAAKNMYLEQQPLTLSRPIANTLNYLWYQTGYRYETLLSEKAQLLSEQFDTLYALATQADSQGINLAEFTDMLAEIKANPKNTPEIEYPLEKDDSVNIMTIHKSKGLQFKHVFITGTTATLKPESEAAYYFDEETGLTIKPTDGTRNYFFIKEKKLAQAKELAEFRRLVYVACTRAIQDFYITGNIEVSSADQNYHLTDTVLFNPVVNLINLYYKEFYKNSDLSSQDQNVQFEKNETFTKKLPFIKNAPFTLELIRPQNKEILFDFEKEKLPTDLLRNKIIDENIQFYQKENKNTIILEKNPIVEFSPSAFEQLTPAKKYTAKISAQNMYETELASFVNYDEEINEDELPKNTISKSDFGTLMHTIMENSANEIESIVQNSDEKLCIVNQSIEGFFNNFSSEEKKQNLLKICKRMENSFKKSELWKKFQLSKELKVPFWKTEWKFKMRIEKNIVNGSMDLIFKNEDDTYTLVDYKTNKSINPEYFFYQQSLYKMAAANILGIDSSKINCFLYYFSFEKAIDITNFSKQIIDESIFEELKKLNL